MSKDIQYKCFDRNPNFRDLHRQVYDLDPAIWRGSLENKDAEIDGHPSWNTVIRNMLKVLFYAKDKNHDTYKVYCKCQAHYGTIDPQLHAPLLVRQEVADLVKGLKSNARTLRICLLEHVSKGQFVTILRGSISSGYSFWSPSGGTEEFGLAPARLLCPSLVPRPKIFQPREYTEARKWIQVGAAAASGNAATRPRPRGRPRKNVSGDGAEIMKPRGQPKKVEAPNSTSRFEIRCFEKHGKDFRPHGHTFKLKSSIWRGSLENKDKEVNGHPSWNSVLKAHFEGVKALPLRVPQSDPGEVFCLGMEHWANVNEKTAFDNPLPLEMLEVDPGAPAEKSHVWVCHYQPEGKAPVFTILEGKGGRFVFWSPVQDNLDLSFAMARAGLVKRNWAIPRNYKARANGYCLKRKREVSSTDQDEADLVSRDRGRQVSALLSPSVVEVSPPRTFIEHHGGTVLRHPHAGASSTSMAIGPSLTETTASSTMSDEGQGVPPNVVLELPKQRRFASDSVPVEMLPLEYDQLREALQNTPSLQSLPKDRQKRPRRGRHLVTGQLMPLGWLNNDSHEQASANPSTLPSREISETRAEIIDLTDIETNTTEMSSIKPEQDAAASTHTPQAPALPTFQPTPQQPNPVLKTDTAFPETFLTHEEELQVVVQLSIYGDASHDIEMPFEGCGTLESLLSEALEGPFEGRIGNVEQIKAVWLKAGVEADMPKLWLRPSKAENYKRFLQQIKRQLEVRSGGEELIVSAEIVL